MKTSIQNLKNLILRTLVLVILFQFTRLFFYFLNSENFSDSGLFDILQILIYGIIFDLSAISYIVGGILFLQLIPGNFKYSEYYLKPLKILYVSVNSILLLSNSADAAFFEFSKKRSTYFIFDMLGFGNKDNSFIGLIPTYIADYYYVLVFWAVLSFLLYFFYFDVKIIEKVKYSIKIFLFEFSILIFFSVLLIIGARGGFAGKPISIIDATGFKTQNEATLILNTPFTIIKTIGTVELERVNFFSEQEISLNYSTIKQYQTTETFKKKNVVIIILESFSKEYIGALTGGTDYTPFLSSLIKQGKSYSNAFANGSQSVHALPAVLASIPVMIDMPFIYSAYSTNKFDNLVCILKEKGYETAFFHGGNDGTMGFENFAKSIKTDYCFQRSSYPVTSDFDGNWGVFDHAFLGFSCKKISEMKQPFFSYIFTLSSHHPYTIPEKFQSKFNKYSEPVLNAVAYSDYSLELFFENCKKQDWYKNTLFVLTADHTGPISDKKYQSEVGKYAIPILYFCPGDSTLKGIDTTKLTQQIDIMPSILNYLNYENAFFSLGNSVFDKNEKNYSINFKSGIYKIIMNDFILFFDGKKSIALFNLVSDPALTVNLLNNNMPEKIILENYLKANIQNYNNSLIDNKMSLR